MEIIFNTLVSIFIFLSSTAYMSGQQFDDTQLLVFKMGIPFLWLVGLCITPKRRVVNVWFNALIGYAFIQTLLLNGEPRIIATQPLVLIFLALILYYTLAERLGTIRPIINGICWTIAFQAIIVLLQATGRDPICINDARLHNTALVGLFGAKYVFGAYMAIVTPILLFNKRKLFGILSAILCICSLSWASIGLMLLSLLVGAWFKGRRAFQLSVLPIILSAILIYSFILHNPNNPILSLKYKVESRIHLESKFLPVLFSKPLTGYGLRSFYYIGPQIVNHHNDIYGDMKDAWNCYLEQGIQLGLPIIVIFLSMCFDVIKRFLRYPRDNQLIGIFCSLLIIPFGMLFHDYVNHPSINTLLICILSTFAIRGVYEG